MTGVQTCALPIYPWRAWLGPLAAVLTGEAEADELAGWAEWAKARPGDVH